MKRATIRQITLWLGVALSLLAVNAAISYRNILKLIENEQQVSHTHEVLAKLETTVSTLKDAETGQRGYLLTGKEQYLEPYKSAVASVNTQIAQLRQLTADNSRQQQRIQNLEQAIATKLAELQQTIALRRQSGLNAALQIVQTNRGKQIMDRIRQLVAQMEAEENQLLQQRSQESQASATSSLFTFTLASGLDAFLIVLMYYMFRHHELKRRQEEEKQRQLLMELRSSEEKFRQLAENITEIVFWMSDANNSQILYVSPAYERIWGRSCQSLYANFTEWMQAIHPEDTERVRAQFLQAGNRGNYDEEYRIIRADGAVRWIRGRGFGINNQAGEPYRLIGIAEDITDRKLAEQRYRYIFEAVEVSIWEEDFSAVKAALAAIKEQGVHDFQQYFTSQPDVVAELASLIKVLDVNEATLRMFGAQDKQQFFVALDQTFLPESLQVLAQELCAMAEEREYFESEAVVQTFQGERLNVLISIKFPPPDAEFSSVLVSMTNISDRKQSEELLRQRKAASDLERKRLRTVLDLLPVGVWIADAKGRAIEANPMVRSIWGEAIPVVESIDEYAQFKGWWADTGERISAHEWALKRAVERGETSINEEIDIENFDGVRKTILNSVVPIADEDGVVVNAAVVNVDISQRKSIETQLRRSAQRLQVVHQIDQAILTLTSPEAIAHTALLRLQQLLACDQVAMVLFDVATSQAEIFAGEIGNYTKGTILPLADCVPLEFVQRQEWYVPDIAHLQARPAILEQQFAAGLKSFLLVALRFDNNIIGCLALCARKPDAFSSEDIVIATEVASQLAITIQQSRLREEIHQYTQQLEQRVTDRTMALQEANQELEAFTYSVSHDLRAPLRTIQGFAQALQEDYGDRLDDMGQEYIRYMAEGAVQMDMLIADLLAYSRLSRVEIQLQPVDLNSVVEAARKQLGIQIQERMADISVEKLLVVQAHRSTLVQVVTNLIGNAIKFVPSEVQPKIHLYTQEKQDSIRLWVVDNGIGIAPEHQERIFRVFERLHGIEIYPGTGIGLAIVRKGLERMGGCAGVESQLGAGSRFWIELPKAVLDHSRS